MRDALQYLPTPARDLLSGLLISGLGVLAAVCVLPRAALHHVPQRSLVVHVAQEEHAVTLNDDVALDHLSRGTG